MSEEDWYRNADWNGEIEAAFEAKLARSRSQKAQYLRIQGSILRELHPGAALRLLERCIAEGEVFHIAAAFLDAAHAHYALGDVEGALQSLEAAMEQQEREPMFRTSAAFDYAMLVALHERVERYDRTLAVVERCLGEAFFASMVFQAKAAQAIIYSARGRVEEARDAAREALGAADVPAGWIPGQPQVGVVPRGDNLLSERLRALA